jgi:acetoacetate decarboxylase
VLELRDFRVGLKFKLLRMIDSNGNGDYTHPKNTGTCINFPV